MNISKTTISLALTATLGATGAVNADENPFGMRSLDSGYLQLAEAKAQEGKCGAGMASSDNKTKEGNCGSKAKEGNCGAKKAKEGNCGGEKQKSASKAKDGKCGEGKCGGNK
jgi:uncharacterized low-complexity protein